MAPKKRRDVNTDMTTESLFQQDETGHAQTKIRALVTAMAVCCLFLVFLTASYFTDKKGHCDIIIDDRINPNRACPASLMRLPNIGPRRAAAIIEFRQKAGEKPVAFETTQDLEKINGIGPKTVEAIEPWLCFERSSASNGGLGN